MLTFFLDFILVSVVRLCLQSYMKVNENFPTIWIFTFPAYFKKFRELPANGWRLESPLSSTIQKLSVHSCEWICRTPYFVYYISLRSYEELAPLLHSWAFDSLILFPCPQSNDKLLVRTWKLFSARKFRAECATIFP